MEICRKYHDDDNDEINDGISVVVSTYDDPINFIDQCINSLLCQEKVFEVIIIDSSKKDDIKKFCQSLKNDNNNKINYIYTPPKGLSDARNKGMNVAKKNTVAFTDSDCITDKNWAKNIYISFYASTKNNVAENVAIVGGKVVPRWISKPNKILSNSAISQGFYSLFDMGEELREVDQIYGGNFAINKSLIEGSLFSTELGRKKNENLLGGEETRLCKQAKKNNLKIIYNPDAIVWHQIPEERSNFRWMWKRIYYGGISRVIVGGRPTPKEVNIPYSIYDAIFLMIFIFPYTYGIIKAGLNKKIVSVRQDL